MIRPYAAKILQKSRRLAQRLRRPARVPDVDEFFACHWKGAAPADDYLFAREQPTFFFSGADHHKYADALRRSLPASCQRILLQAERALAHVVDFLGSGERPLGGKIDWHTDFKSGKRWPLKRYAAIRIVDLSDVSDVKVPWELSRLGFLPDLGRGYWLTANTDYAGEFRSILDDWRKANPIDIGVNWTCSMEVAIRAINIIWGIYLFSGAKELDELFMREIIRLLYYHGGHIEDNLEIVSESANSNHLIADYLGLFYLGLLFPEFDRSAAWKSLALKGLEDQMRQQVFADGADYECSTSYHRLVLEMFLSAFILGRLNSISFSADYVERLRRMIGFSLAMTAPSGLAPLIGDNDDGFIVRISAGNPADHRPLIDVGLVMFGEHVPSSIPVSEERLWYLGPDSLVAFHSPELPTTALFKDSGYAVIGSHDFHLVFNMAGIPRGNFGGHKHNDLLSFTLEIDSVPYLIDPGTFCYTADSKMRNLSRSTSIHNTITVDGKEQCRFSGQRLFHLLRDASPRLHLWADLDRCAIVSGSHDGYMRLKDGVVHRRTIWASMTSSSLLIVDELTGDGKSQHRFDLRFVTPMTTVSKTDDSTFVIHRNQAKPLVIRATAENLHSARSMAIEYFPRYGIRARGTAVEFTYRAAAPTRIWTTISRHNCLLSTEHHLKIAETDLKARFSAAGVAL